MYANLNKISDIRKCFTMNCVTLPTEQKKMIMDELPKDPMMLYSVVNMKLRDCYSSLDELCDDMHIDKDELVKQLAAYGFEYNPENNKFW